MFLLLVTNRGSNILEDLDTLRLLSKLVPEYAGNMLDEEAISRAAFDLMFAFDEVISHGHKENITVQQVRAVALQGPWQRLQLLVHVAKQRYSAAAAAMRQSLGCQMRHTAGAGRRQQDATM
jgi:hypothetical protein